MKKQSIVVIAALGLMLSGCSGGDSNITAEETPPVSVRYVNGDPTNAAAGVSVRAVEEEAAIPMLFLFVRLRAYQYGPRAVMLGNDPTWSLWELARFDDNADFLLWNGGVADLKTSYAEFAANPDYVDQVGTFSFDFLVSEGMPDLINANNSVCGGHNSGAYDARAYKYPDLNFGTCQHTDVYADDGWRIVYLRTIFARNDWFSVPMQIYPANEPNEPTGSQFVCYETSEPLSPFQAEVLTGLMNRDLPEGATVEGGMVYDPACLELEGRAPVDIPIALVPMTDDLAVAQLAQDAIPQPPILTDDGQEIPQPDKFVTSSSLRAEVSWRVTPSMIVNYDVFNVDEDTSDIILRPGPNGAPWGMALRFVDETTSAP